MRVLRLRPASHPHGAATSPRPSVAERLRRQIRHAPLFVLQAWLSPRCSVCSLGARESRYSSRTCFTIESYAELTGPATRDWSSGRSATSAVRSGTSIPARRRGLFREPVEDSHSANHRRRTLGPRRRVPPRERHDAPPVQCKFPEWDDAFDVDGPLAKRPGALSASATPTAARWSSARTSRRPPRARS